MLQNQWNVPPLPFYLVYLVWFYEPCTCDDSKEVTVFFCRHNLFGPAHDWTSVHGKLTKLLKANILRQLRLVVLPIIYRVLCIPGGLPDFFHQQSYITFSSLRCKHATNPSMPHAGWLANVFCRHLVWNSF